MKKICKRIRDDFGTYVVIFSIFMIIVFTIVCLYMQFVIQMEVSSTLIEKFYEFFGYELLILGGVKVSKNVKEMILDKIRMEDNE